MMPMGYGYGGPMVMPPPPMPMPMPMPMPVPVPVGIPMPYPESTTTTTTTEANNGGDGDNGDHGMAIAVPMPVPHFIQIAIPGFMPPNCMPENNKNKNRNKDCPPCPPCSCNPCTPSFFSFCSPCHLECRCKNGKPNPIPKDPTPPQPLPGPAFPMPIPFPGPAPVVIVPFPPHFSNPKKPKRPRESDCESRPVSNSCSEESKPHDSCESNQSRRKKRKKKRRKSKYDIYRRNFDLMKRNRDDNELVEPVLTYRSRNGDIKMRRRLSNDEADALLGERDSYNKVHLMAGEGENKRPRLMVMSNPGMRNHRRRGQLVASQSQHLLGDGRKELIFKTPENKRISNLSVSFQINK